LQLLVLCILLFFAFLVIVYFFLSFEKRIFPQTKFIKSSIEEMDRSKQISKRSMIQNFPNNYRIHFQAGESKLTKGDTFILDEMIHLTKDNLHEYIFCIQGMADSSGVRDRNKELAKSRAREVLFYLIQNGVNQKNVKTLKPKVVFGRDKIEKNNFRSVQIQLEVRDYIS